MTALKLLPFVTLLTNQLEEVPPLTYFGYFSFVANKGDTIIFSSVGYKKANFIIPDTLNTSKYSLIQVMYKDTILLKAAHIYPWPSKEQFAEVFVNADIPNDDYKRAKANLERASLKERADATPMDGGYEL